MENIYIKLTTTHFATIHQWDPVVLPISVNCFSHSQHIVKFMSIHNKCSHRDMIWFLRKF